MLMKENNKKLHPSLPALDYKTYVRKNDNDNNDSNNNIYSIFVPPTYFYYDLAVG